MDIYSKWLVKQFIAHRGLHNDVFPENSLGAFQNAIDNNYAIELDVHELDDGTMAVFHDDKLARMTGVDGYIGNLTAADLKAIRLLNTEYGIPTFNETLDFVAGRTPLLIEIKNTNKVGGLEKKILDALKEYNGEYAVQSFNPYSIEYFKNNAPHILRGQLSCFFRGTKISAFRRIVLRNMLLNKSTKPDFISYDFGDLPNRFVKKYPGRPVLAWTIRSDSDMERALPYCDNIIFEGFIPKRG
ncbi:MAG: glycerophosphodiester phosphodiesterase [Clostridiales bacterium]|jgi:glycerophosphoryl diester phosphodiesterase|nr:glycerophosphodiester phosphodiesterase [Clostridiales bacterium]